MQNFEPNKVHIVHFLVLFSSYSSLPLFCLFFWLSSYWNIFSSCWVQLRHHTLWEWLHFWMHQSVTTPYGNGSFPGCSCLASNLLGIDPLQDVAVTCHPSYTMLTEVSDSATGAPSTSNTEKNYASKLSAVFLFFFSKF